MKEFWLVRVFHNDSISGNLTGVVYSDTPLDSDESLKIARRLNLPDTAFIWKQNGDLFHRTFSPYEELAFCTQTLLAAAAIEDEGNSQEDTFTFNTASCKVTVRRLDGKWWVESKLSTVAKPFNDQRALKKLKIDPRNIKGVPCVAGIGRERLYLPVYSIDMLYNIKCSPQDVLTICRSKGLNGICFYYKFKDDHVGLRVFTTSLEGAEDAATGGAALGIVSCENLTDLKLDSIFRVDQGTMEGNHRGSLYVWKDTFANRVRLGGEIEILSKGVLWNATKGGARFEK